MPDNVDGQYRQPQELSPIELRRRTVDGRGVADIRLLQVEDGPGRGQRLLAVRNGNGIGIEIAVDRGFDIASATWRGINIGWNSANGLPWPANSVDAEEGIGFYRNFDGFVVTCGLDHIGGASRESADRFMHKHRKQVFHPLHGRISSQRASLSGYGIDWNRERPVIWAEAVVRQSSVFGENLVLQRRIQLDVFGNTIGIEDAAENRGFRPTPHAILYHVNFGYPFVDESIEIHGDIGADLAEAFNAEDKGPRDDFVDYFQEIPVTLGEANAAIELRNRHLLGGVRARLSFSPTALPSFGVWRAFQSGVYALALEPTRRFGAEGTSPNSITLDGGQMVTYAVAIELAPIVSSGAPT
ncbi:MAG: DUF4432 family protein [Mesorhizobium sp.]|uniref:DUF4432 family protein n=1 Tax=Mesorhizobium sp. TaxID=1871066 RepID=UPI000FE87DC7|nr:DUF4432 family protein [Mesorhizobium sp.]RWH46348.1 MAG: DUF4432 family protein [Mesorhizobium sp.]